MNKLSQDMLGFMLHLTSFSKKPIMRKGRYLLPYVLDFFLNFVVIVGF